MGGRRERCCRSRNTEGGSKINTSQHSYVPLTATNAGCSEVMLRLNVNSEAAGILEETGAIKSPDTRIYPSIFFLSAGVSFSSCPVNSCSLM